MKKRTEILIEFDELLVVSQPGKPIHLWCNACCQNATFITPAQAAVIARVTVRTVNQWVESGGIHFVETSDGFLLVCIQSVTAKVKYVAATTQTAPHQESK